MLLGQLARLELHRLAVLLKSGQCPLRVVTMEITTT